MTAQEHLTLVDRVWEQHLIRTSEDGLDLIHVDRSLLTDLTGTVGLDEMAEDGRDVHDPALHLAVPDHLIGTGEDRLVDPRHTWWVDRLAERTRATGIRHMPRGSGGQGIVHIIGLERGFSLPGLTVVCGDSHTSTHGAVGALAWGIGSSEVKHVLATQTLWLRKPRRARIRLDGALGRGVYAKDVVLWLIGHLGADYARGHALEFAGHAVELMSIEERATLCNLAIEMSARYAIIAPDQTTFAYLQGRELSPKGADWDAAMVDWQGLCSDPDAVFDLEASADVSSILPQVTWGTSPEHVIDVGGCVPANANAHALAYIGLSEGERLAGTPIDYVFIGSCANGRIEDLRIAANIVRARKVAKDVVAWVVPGSEAVRRQAVEEGLEAVFAEAGFLWRQPGCSMCVSVNGDIVPPGKRCVATSNRNFVGRQGAGARTHLASPATAAASAIAGAIADPRPYAR